MDDAGTTTHRRMGEILVERRFITDDQLAVALGIQERTGRLLGEICVEKWGLDRFALADALGEQWEEIDHGPATPSADCKSAPAPVALTELEEVRARLAESEAACAGLAGEQTISSGVLVTGLATQSQNAVW